MHTIDLFIWGYQQHFQHSLEYAAKELFSKLDPHFDVEIFLVGLLRNGEVDDNPVCIEPDDCGWKPNDFLSVRTDAKHLMAIDGEEGIITTHQSHYDGIQRRRRGRAEESAILKALKSRRYSRPANEEYFFSGFVTVAKYDVGIVLAISHRHGVVHYQLPTVNADDRYRVPDSLLRATAGEFLSQCIGALYVPDPTEVSDLWGRDSEGILRKAGSRLMEAPVFAAKGIEGLYGLFDACNYIASLNYEGAESKGGMIITRDSHPNVELSFRLATPVRLNHYRTIRKLLEVTSSGESLVTDGAKVIGIGQTIGRYDQAKADLLQVNFIGHHKWEILHAEHSLMKVAYGLPSLSLPALNRTKFFETFEIVFGPTEAIKAGLIYSLALEATRQKHGTILIITNEAHSEALRLARQATLIERIKMTSKLLRSVTAIDGAVLLDQEGDCYAIGAILDGEACPEGDPGRGARFNSTLRYISFLQKRSIRCIGVIVSEDGTSEVIPDLPPRIPRRILEEKDELAGELIKATPPNLDQMWKVLNWLENHRFYLPISLCEKANALSRIRREALDAVGAINLVVPTFVPHPLMSDEFLS